MNAMSETTRLLAAIDQGDADATAALFPLVYEELRRLARAQMANEREGHTLQPTALIHEAYLRLTGNPNQNWDGRGHFFAAAAEAMRRILVESARRKQRLKRGGDQERFELDEEHLAMNLPPDELLMLHDALDSLAAHDEQAAELVKLRYFVGMTVDEAADSLKISRTTAYRHWTYARAWLIAQVQQSK
jgi:RNA polymerase sigma factor (TIGR02999 family)